MNSRQTSTIGQEPLTEDDVVQFLTREADFFTRHPGLLAQLELPHQSGEGAISLVERQLSVLREKNRGLEGRLKDLISVARSNHELSDKVHRLALRLIRSHSAAEVIEAVEEVLREDFGASDTVAVLFHNASDIVQADDTRFLRRVERQSGELKAFATFLERARPRCGRARDSQLEFLFPDHAMEIGSVALIPLGERAEIGMLAIGSGDSDRFHPGMSTDFLERIGELVGLALSSRMR
ncbi:MAG: hypothetical protein AMJ59_04555 [Gammaproteobacteria bacterium SG8_31]|jgi:uncharacterized protein YigA (DUF484 family)|nr:MAG: hypothetical protein AMJ59_04555 [Gammaproteobacteria bacterium SG8_31]